MKKVNIKYLYQEKIKVMTIEEKINKLQAELDQLKAEARKEVKEWNWVPEAGDQYFVVGPTVTNLMWDNDRIDENYQTIGNYFKTQEEAEQYLEYLTVLQELRVFAREKNKGEKLFSDLAFNTTYHSFIYDHEENRVITDVNDYGSNGLPMFISEADAKEAIAHFGDRLKILFTFNL